MANNAPMTREDLYMHSIDDMVLDANNAPMTREDHWSRPVAMAPGGQWLSLREVIEGKTAQVSFAHLSLEQQSELVAERIQQRPKFEVGTLASGIVDKERAITEVHALTSIGCSLIDVEGRMIKMLIESALNGNL